MTDVSSGCETAGNFLNILKTTKQLLVCMTNQTVELL
jgi:hypothetical protein